MLLEKNTLLGLDRLWFTGCSAVSMGHWPFCASASISVPGAPASSLLTGSQPVVLKPGVEIWAPVAVVLALLNTDQPDPPRLEMSLAPVSDGELSSAAGAAPAVAPAVREAAAKTTAMASTERRALLMSDSPLIWAIGLFVSLSYKRVNGPAGMAMHESGRARRPVLAAGRRRGRRAQRRRGPGRRRRWAADSARATRRAAA